MLKTVVQTERAPAAVGPYSQAIRAGDLVFCSGQIPLDPSTGSLVEGDIDSQTRQVVKNLGEVLAAAGASWQDVVKTTIYLTDLADFTAVNRIYGEVVGTAPPARATVQVSALPKGASVEIDAIAHVGGAK